MTETSLGYRRLIGWIAVIGAVLVGFDLLTGAEWASLLLGLLK